MSSSSNITRERLNSQKQRLKEENQTYDDKGATNVNGMERQSKSEIQISAKGSKSGRFTIASQPLKKHKHSDDDCSGVEEITELNGQSQPNLPKTPIDSEKPKKKLAEGEIPIPKNAFTINPSPKMMTE